jgi:tryptophan 7-halogenase
MMKRILVVGSGNAGLITATILKKRLGIQVDVISSKSIDIVGVGEGSTEHFSEYMRFVGILPIDLIKHCGSTFKSGIMFEGWGDNDYLHSVTNKYLKPLGQYQPILAKQIIERYPMTSEYLWDNKLDKWYLTQEKQQFEQYHFDSRKLNDFLINFSKKMGIGFYDDKIKNVIISDNGDIEMLVGEYSNYDYDFYIDATGFRKVLIGEMGVNWNSYGEYLKMNSAITFQTDEEDEYNLWTLSKTMDAGWLFRIPVQDRYGNGYIFDDNYITEEQAKKEVENYFNKEIDFGKKFKFDPGAVDRAWINNCVAVGLSSAFVEPLEASSIGTTIQQSFLLMHRITNYNEKSIEMYNKSFNDIMENTRDFIALHYVTNKCNTKFWKDMSKVELPETLKHNLEIWKNKLPISDDFSNLSQYKLFDSNNYIMILDGLLLFDIDSIEKEFESLNDEIKKEIADVTNMMIVEDNDIDEIGHKEYIKLMRTLPI